MYLLKINIVNHNHIFNFRRGSIDLDYLEFSECDLDRKHMLMIFADDANIRSAILGNIVLFRQKLTEMLYKTARVTYLRIGGLQVHYREGFIFVEFYIYERVKSYGNVEIPKDDLVLNGKKICYSMQINRRFHFNSLIIFNKTQFHF